jgi:hypothetical protein
MIISADILIAVTPYPFFRDEKLSGDELTVSCP